MALLKSNSRVLATTEKHLPVRQIADKEYLKNANRMMVKYNLKHKIKEFHVGDCVTVRIPCIDQASTDPNRLPCIIVQVIGTARAMYRLRCKSGVLNKCYSACDLELFEGNYNLSVKGWERSTRVSLRAASKESTPWSAFSKNRCMCTAGCSTQRCPCKKNKIEFTSHCHKGHNCKNKNCTPASAMKLSTPSNSNKTPFLDTQASLSCACKTRCNSAKYCCCKKNKLSCTAVCHPGHSCTNGNHNNPLCNIDLTADLELSKDDEDDKDTWVTICHVKLTMYHKAILTTSKSWLDDLIITVAQYMLKQQHPSIGGFQPPALSQNLSMITPLEQFVQIVNVNKNNWIALSTVGCQNTCVRIYDCNGGKQLPKSTLKLISVLLQTNLLLSL